MPVKNDSHKKFNVNRYQAELLLGNRIFLSRAITLAESNLAKVRAQSEALIESIMPTTGNSIRIGITGSPGVGKSTFIEAFGKHLTSVQKKVAVLTIDPSSQRTKGSILGDKTRMDELSKDPGAFIRPTASGQSVGGVSTATREAILLCEAAGYNVVLIETVGVGQSEVAVRGMVDFFLLLMLPGAGDELQGIKKGIMEMADGIVITKGDGENIHRAKRAQSDFKNALHLFQSPESGVAPKVLITSALAKTGIKEAWQMIESFQQNTKANGFFDSQRQQQKIAWFYSTIEMLVKNSILKKTKTFLAVLEKRILARNLSPTLAARMVLKKIKL
jgi:LAO/AO transport system kinase